MKNTIICSIAVLSAALLAACTETTRIWPEEGESKAYVEVSSQKVIFDADGGNAVITVATNADGWDYAAEGDWFTVARQDGNALLVETLINAGAETLTGKLTVSAEKNGETVSQEVALVQRAERSVNLSAEGTANCYIARTGGVYKFDASVKGNGGGNGVHGASDYIANYGLAIEDGAFAELLWESRHDGDKTMSREIIDGAPIYRSGYVTFSTGRSEGNAVIAVKDIKGNIVWSWHIWVCNDEITAHDHIDSEGKVAAVIMDRNLGALNNTPMDVGNRGMFYEWGRKDPFTPSRSPYHADTDGNNVPAYNEPNTAIGDGTGTWVYNAQAAVLATPPATCNRRTTATPTGTAREQTRRPRIRDCGVPRRPFSTPALRATRSRDPISGAFPPETTRSPTAAQRRITTKPASAPNGTGTPTKTAGAAGKTPATTTRWPATSTTRTTSR